MLCAVCCAVCEPEKNGFGLLQMVQQQTELHYIKDSEDKRPSLNSLNIFQVAKTLVTLKYHLHSTSKTQQILQKMEDRVDCR